MKRLTLTAAVLILVANAAVFARVAWNRGGEPPTITLTERELPLSSYHYSSSDRADNSGLSLRLKWRVAHGEAKDDRFWYHSRNISLDEAKFRSLGFRPVECDKPRDYRRRELPRKGWAVLEYDGPAHARLLTRLRRELQKATTEYDRDRLARDLEASEQRESRLYVVDVAAERAELSQAYAPGANYLILAAELRNSNDCTDKYQVYISRILTDAINVPVRLHSHFENLPQRLHNAPWDPAYRATLAIGRLAEPWLTGVERIDNGSAP